MQLNIRKIRKFNDITDGCFKIRFLLLNSVAAWQLVVGWWMLRILRWLIFGAVISVLPLLLAYMDLQVTSQPASLEKVLGSGELFVIIWVLSSTAVGELFGSGQRLAWLKLIAGGATLFFILTSGHEFATITEAKAANVHVDEALIVSTSIQLFLWSLVSSLTCVTIAEVAK